MEINTPGLLALTISDEPFLEEATTAPLKIECIDIETQDISEYVVKFNNRVTRNGCGIASEIICGHLAKYFDIQIPDFGLVEITETLYRSISDFSKSHIYTSRMLTTINSNRHGLNFGSKIMTGTMTSPTTINVKKDELEKIAAVEDIFAFDALIYNADRNNNIHNLLVADNKYYVYDHEKAFCFLSSSNPSTPNKLDFRTPGRNGVQFLKEHLFKSCLNDKEIDFDRFLGKLGKLDDKTLANIIKEIPWEIRTDHKGELSTIISHIKNVRENPETFRLNLLRVLA